MSQLVKNLSSVDLNSLQLIISDTIPCEVLYDGIFRKSFISLISPMRDPLISAFYFSSNGTVYPKGCYVMPITPNLKVNISFPTVILNDGTNKYFLNFATIDEIRTLMNHIKTKQTVFINNKMTPDYVYSTFFSSTATAKMVAQLPSIKTDNLFKSVFRLSGKAVDNPIAVAMLMHQEKWFRTYTKHSLHVVTWNIDQKLPPENVSDLWGGKPYDIMIFNCQEIDMTMDCIMHGDSEEKKKKWDAGLQAALNTIGTYTYITGMQLGTSYIAAFIDTRLVQTTDTVNENGKDVQVTTNHVKNPSTGSVVLGSMGFYNKTAIGIRFQFDDTNFCFICSHLSHGRKNVERRNAEFWKVQAEMKFPVKFDDGSIQELSMEDHDCIIWSGDFNYRLTIPDPESRERFDDAAYLWEFDQLREAHRKNKAFVGFTEGPITFRPTYKFDKGTANLDSSSKQRGPAWCDRIFLRIPGMKEFVKLQKYDSRKTLLMSDHHPVYGEFEVNTWVNDVAKMEEKYDEVSQRLSVLKWATKLSDDFLDFGTVRLGEQKTLTLRLRNEGQIPVLFAAQPSVPWVNVHPQRSTIFPDKECELLVSVLIDTDALAQSPILNAHFLQPVQILHPCGKAPQSFLVTGNYVLAPIGLPLPFFLRLPGPLSRCPPDLFVPQIPGKPETAPIMRLPQSCEVPEELHIIAEELLSVVNDPYIFTKPGESEEILQILEKLRTRTPLNREFSQNALSAVYLLILGSFQSPLVDVERLRAFQQKETDINMFLATLPASDRSLLMDIASLAKKVRDRVWDPEEEGEFPALAVFGSYIASGGHDFSQEVKDLGTQLFVAIVN